MTQLDWDTDTLFMFLGHSTMFLSERDKNRVFNDMAYKLIEWQNASRRDLRGILLEHEIPFEERCAECNEDIEPNDEEHPKCAECAGKWRLN